MDRIYVLTITAPAGTPQSAPVTKAFPLEDGLLDKIQMLIPFGHNGTTGIAVKHGDVTLLPWGQGSWLIGSNEWTEFPVNQEVLTDSLHVEAYNGGTFDHSWYLRAFIKDSPAIQEPTAPLQAADTSLENYAPAPDPLSPDALLTEDQLTLGADFPDLPDTTDIGLPEDTSPPLDDSEPPPDTSPEPLPPTPQPAPTPAPKPILTKPLLHLVYAHTDGFEISWPAIPSATGYHIVNKQLNGIIKNNFSIPASQHSAKCYGLHHGWSYNVTVNAIGGPAATLRVNLP